MAVDEAVLESAVAGGPVTVRIYAWSHPTVSLGYFQPADALTGTAELSQLAAVRRLSGGGAIVHHHEITYSIAVPPESEWARQPSRLYRLAAESIVRVLQRHGVPAARRGENAAGDARFLCFGRGDPNDVVLAGYKIVGSAQRRRRGAILQHGSLLLRRSLHAPEFPGIDDLASPAVDAERLAFEMAEALAGAIGGPAEWGVLTDTEEQLARQLAEEKYGQLDWRRQESR